MVLGENIGTTITANIAAAVANTNAKRAALAHTLFNIFGVIWALISHKNYEKLRYQQILTNSLAHDLKSPITVVSGYVENIEQNICPEKKDAYISSIGQNVGHMNDIISNIIELSKLETNKL